MKNYTLLVTLFLLSSMMAFAQIRVGLTGGLQVANQKNELGGLNLSGMNRVGFMAGLLLDASLSDNLSVRPQLLYSVKGTKYDLGLLSGLTGAKDKATIAFNYIEVPVQLTYGLEAGSGRLVIGAGPYVAYALSGKSNATIGGQSSKESVMFGSGEDQVKRFDYGLRLSIGYELYSGLLVSAYYSPGLANLANGDSGSTKNTAFGVSLGLLFGEQ